MKSLLRLRPYLTKYKGTLLWGVCTVIISNLFVVATPLFIGNAVDTIKHGIEAGVIQYSKLLRDAGLIVGFALVAGFMTFLTRQTIIVVPRKIKYDLRNDFLAHIQKLPLSYFQNTPTGDLMAHARTIFLQCAMCRSGDHLPVRHVHDVFDGIDAHVCQGLVSDAGCAGSTSPYLLCRL